jgi:hypothetical protein
MPLNNPPVVKPQPDDFVQLPNGVAIKATVTTTVDGKVWRITLKDTDNEEREIVAV